MFQYKNAINQCIYFYNIYGFMRSALFCGLVLRDPNFTGGK